MAGNKQPRGASKPTRSRSSKKTPANSPQVLNFGTIDQPKQSFFSQRRIRIWSLAVISSFAFLCILVFTAPSKNLPTAAPTIKNIEPMTMREFIQLTIPPSVEITPSVIPAKSPVPFDNETLPPTSTLSDTNTPTNTSTITPTFTTNEARTATRNSQNEARTATSAQRSSNLTGTAAAIFEARTATYGAVYATGTWRAENYTPPPRTRVPVPTGGGFTKAPTIPPPPSGGGSCPGFDYTCPRLTCAQAYACLAAGNTKLDADHDGKPCEAQCGR